MSQCMVYRGVPELGEYLGQRVLLGSGFVENGQGNGFQLRAMRIVKAEQCSILVTEPTIKGADRAT